VSALPLVLGIGPGRGGRGGLATPRPLFRVLKIVVWLASRGSLTQRRGRGAIINDFSNHRINAKEGCRGEC